MSERPLEELLDEFWLAGTTSPPDEPASDERPDDALARLGRPDITVRGRNLRDVLRPAYDALRTPD